MSRLRGRGSSLDNVAVCVRAVCRGDTGLSVVLLHSSSVAWESCTSCRSPLAFQRSSMREKSIDSWVKGSEGVRSVGGFL